jgi:hypothetical protein
MAICRQREEAAWRPGSKRGGHGDFVHGRSICRPYFFLAVISLFFQILVLDNVTVDTITADEVPVARLPRILSAWLIFFKWISARS